MIDALSTVLPAGLASKASTAAATTAVAAADAPRPTAGRHPARRVYRIEGIQQIGQRLTLRRLELGEAAERKERQCIAMGQHRCGI
jgi:hypothetical protein